MEDNTWRHYWILRGVYEVRMPVNKQKMNVYVADRRPTSALLFSFLDVCPNLVRAAELIR